MSSFLQRLKGGTSTVDNKAPPDNAGVVIRKLEKKVVSQPVEQLGITFGNDGEVVSVAPRSAAAAANIPVGYMVFDVNGEFVENEEQFAEAARKNLNLVIKLQSTAGISELIARVLRDEEMRSNGEISESSINFDELLRTTPRFNFLSGDHPLFFRYTKRLKHASQAAALIAQRTREAELQRQKEIKERMRRALEEEQAAQRKKEEQEEAERLRQNASSPSDTFANSEPFLKIIKDESEFGQAASEVKKPDVPSAVASPNHPTDPVAATPPPETTLELVAETLPAAPQEPVAPVSAEELLALVGLPTDAPPAAAPSLPSTAAVTPLPQDDETVRYIALPAEEYTLCNGEKVVSVIKRRTGPIPPPPPGEPPAAITAAAATVATSIRRVRGTKDAAPAKSYSNRQRQSERKRSRSPSSRHHSDRHRSSRDDSRHHHEHRSSSSRREYRSSRDSRHRR